MSCLSFTRPVRLVMFFVLTTILFTSGAAIHYQLNMNFDSLLAPLQLDTLLIKDTVAAVDSLLSEECVENSVSHFLKENEKLSIRILFKNVICPYTICIFFHALCTVSSRLSYFTVPVLIYDILHSKIIP